MTMMKKAVRALVGVVSYIVILLATYYINIRFFRVNVVGFTAIIDGVIATVLAGALLFLLKWFRAMEKFERVLLVVIYLLGGFGFAIAIPTVVDRSLSLYILQKLDQRGGGIKEDQIGWVFVNEYVPEDRLVDVRLTEATQSGTVVIKDGCVILTDKGRLLADFSTWFHEYMLPKQRLLNGQYTDDLTNTFRNSVPSPGYECK
jgi:hypothetical protein